MKRDALESETVFLRLPKPLHSWLMERVGKIPNTKNIQDVIRTLLDRERLKHDS